MWGGVGGGGGAGVCLCFVCCLFAFLGGIFGLLWAFFFLLFFCDHDYISHL